MKKKFWIPVLLCMIVALTGCDQGQRMMKPATSQAESPIAEDIDIYDKYVMSEGRFGPFSSAEDALNHEDVMTFLQSPKDFDFYGIPNIRLVFTTGQARDDFDEIWRDHITFDEGRWVGFYGSYNKEKRGWFNYSKKLPEVPAGYDINVYDLD